jgi:anti-anti-sigma regulatory factor
MFPALRASLPVYVSSGLGSSGLIARLGEGGSALGSSSCRTQTERLSESRMSNVARRVDLSQVSFCSARGVGLLLKLLRRTQGAGVRLELVVDTRAARRVLECLEVAELFSTRTDRDSATGGVRTVGIVDDP